VTGADSYDLVLGSAARRALTTQLPERIAMAVWAFCDGPLRENPHRVGTLLRSPFLGQHSARRGVYRVRYRIDDDKHLVAVIDVAYRDYAYRPGRA
jgi:mRNA-degrading endonuclease RelE of RelBE toxin-antitoxin system